MRQINLIIIDDSIIFSQGLASLLKQYPDYVNKIYIAHNYHEALDKLSKESINVAILDLNFESNHYNGFDIAKKIKIFYPEKKIIILTQQAKIENYEILFNDIQIDGYLDKQLGVEETFEALETVMKGKTYIDKNIKSMLEIGRFLNITNKEKEVIKLLSEGLIQKEIAVRLFVSNRTIETHVKNLTRKIGAKNTAHLISIYTKYINGNRESSV